MTVPTDLADEPFVSLTTFRKTDEPIATPLWVVRTGNDVAFWTPRNSGKVKRLRNNPAAELRPCSRRGRVAPDAPTVRGLAEVTDDAQTLRQVEALLRSKYGLQFRVVTLIERVRRGSADRVVVRVRAAS